MASIAEQLGLGANDFILYFETNQGIKAGNLGYLLKRAAKVARNAGAQTRVEGVQRGTLAVFSTAIKKSTLIVRLVCKHSHREGFGLQGEFDLAGSNR